MTLGYGWELKHALTVILYRNLSRNGHKVLLLTEMHLHNKLLKKNESRQLYGVHS